MSRRTSIVVAALVVLVAVAGIAFWSFNRTPEAPPPQATATATPAPKASSLPGTTAQTTAPAPTGSGTGKSWPIDEVVGKADAPNTMIEYFSLDCPHCAAFHAQTMPQIQSQLIDTGKVKLILRDFPLSDVALAAAMVAHCSGDRYDAFVTTFMASQASWVTSKDPISAIKVIARLGGMSDADVGACLQNADLMNQIKARQDDAEKSLAVNSTPSFFVNGKLSVGEIAYADFLKLLPASN